MRLKVQPADVHQWVQPSVVGASGAVVGEGPRSQRPSCTGAPRRCSTVCDVMTLPTEGAVAAASSSTIKLLDD